MAAAPAARRARVPRRALLALLVLAGVAAMAAIVLATGVFGGGGGAGTGIDNSYPTAVARIRERSLSSQTQVSATLGYGAPGTIVVPPGTAPSSVQQAQGTVTTSQGQLTTAQAALAADSDAVSQLGAQLAAAQGKETVDCRGANAAEAAASGAGSSGGAGPCASDVQTVASAQASLTAAAAKVTTDRAQVTSAMQSLGAARSALASAQSSGAVYGQGASYTTLPAIGAIVRRGASLFGVNGQPVVLLYGKVAPWRAFVAGMAPGPDVRELNANLETLGYGHDLGGDELTAATTAAIDRFQTAHGEAPTGQLLLGSVVFEPGAVRVTSVTPTPGAAVQAGPVLSVTSTVRQVTIALDASEQTSIAVGDPVTITLPDNSTTPGRVTYVGSVATTPAGSDNGNGGSGSPTIEVDVTPLRPAATGHLDQAPVNVSITTASVDHALVAPVDALLALASGGYAVEEIGAGGTHHLVSVNTGLFDDADGYVQITGSGLADGQRVVVPAQ